MSERLRVAYAVSEVGPWSTTGGLGEVSASLPTALCRLGVDCIVLMPLYRDVRRKIAERGGKLLETQASTGIWVGSHRLEGRFLRVEDPGLPADAAPVYAYDCPVLFDREGIYGHGDDCARFSVFSRAVLDCAGTLLGAPPDIVHCHDWHTALIPLYLDGPYRHLLPGTASCLTIHNLGYQGLVPPSEMGIAGIPEGYFHPERAEFYGAVNLLKGGITTADMLTTVSPRYAQEIRTAEFGEHLDGVLRSRGDRLRGILNGIDTDVWNPAKDPLIPNAYDVSDLSGKVECRRKLIAYADWNPDDPHPVFGVVSRFVKQKGLDLVAELVPWLVQRSVRLLLLGQGEPRLTEWFQQLATQYPDHVRLRLGHEPAMAHVLQAGCDAFLMPSRYEPCGLSQLYAMRYGTIPIVRAVGGLRDTVVEAQPQNLASGRATGFTFYRDDVGGLMGAVDKALDAFYLQPDLWRQLQLNGMKQDFSWSRSGASYIDVFREAILRRRS